MDSVVLLHALAGLMRSGALIGHLTAVHVHHGLSAHADAWAASCAALCRALAVPLHIERVTVPRNGGEGVEGAARRMRYAAFNRVDADWLLLAHHRDDQAETVLLKMLRGAGVAGAAGMPAERRLPGGATLLRPLLGVARAELQGYAQARALAWVEDESNTDRHFRRNFLRHDILPPLERTFPGAAAALVRAAGHFGEASVLLGELAAIDRAAAAGIEGRIIAERFNRLPVPRARNLLRHAWITAGFRAPETRWLDEAMQQLAHVDADSETCLSTSDGALHVYRGELYFVAPQLAVPAEPTSPRPWSGDLRLAWGGGEVRFERGLGVGLRETALAGRSVTLCARQGGERLQPDARRPRRNLRNLLQERAVPPWERARLPMLWVDDRLAWVGGIGCDAALACPPGETGWMPRWDGLSRQVSPAGTPD